MTSSTADELLGRSYFGSSLPELRVRRREPVEQGSNVAVKTSVVPQSNTVQWDWDQVFASRDVQNLELVIQVLELYSTQKKTWTSSIVDTVNKLTQLEQNWNGSGGEPPSVHEAARMLSVIRLLEPQLDERPFLYPSPKGGMVAEFDVAGRRLSVLIEGGIGMIGSLHDADADPVFVDMSKQGAETDLVQKVLQDG